MPLGIVFGAASSGGRYINPKPTITYNSYGVFNITNADSTANYSSFSSGPVSFGPNNSTVSLSSANSSGTVANRSAKGVTSSPSSYIERKSFTYTYVVPPPPATGPCYNYAGGAQGTRYGNEWMAFYGDPYSYLNPAPGYSQAPSEWYKIS